MRHRACDPELHLFRLGGAKQSVCAYGGWPANSLHRSERHNTRPNRSRISVWLANRLRRREVAGGFVALSGRLPGGHSSGRPPRAKSISAKLRSSNRRSPHRYNPGPPAPSPQAPDPRMYSLLFLGFGSLILCWLLTPPCRDLFRRLGTVDRPDL